MPLLSIHGQQQHVLTLFICALLTNVHGVPASPPPPPPAVVPEGSNMWLDFDRPISAAYADSVGWMWVHCEEMAVNSTACTELSTGLKSMGLITGLVVADHKSKSAAGVVLTFKNSTEAVWPPNPAIEGFTIALVDGDTVISAETSAGAVRGVLRLLVQLRRELPGIGHNYTETSNPTTPLRIWDLWDNRDGSVERGYGGKSVFLYDQLPMMFPRYTLYARLLASTGINAIVWDNVNACGNGNQVILNSTVIQSMRPLVALFFNYGIHSLITPCYSSPIHIGNLDSADPLNSTVAAWWQAKAVEISGTWKSGAFRGFLVKADCEGEPGPATYNRTELQGANAMADALVSVDALCIWRAFAHPPSALQDQALYQFDLFKDWNGQTRENVVLQIKNGPFDFQVREPVHSLFSHLTNVSTILELEATQEYLGQGRHLAHLPSQWEYYLNFNLGIVNGKNASLATVISGQCIDASRPAMYNGIAAVSNLGNDFDWTGGALSSANTYGYGRLAWEANVGAELVSKEWAEAMFGPSDATNEVIDMLLISWNAYENYTSSLGWGFSCAGDHYDLDLQHRNASYIHATPTSVGFDRGIPGGFGATYQPELSSLILSPETCPEELLLTFHHVPYSTVLGPRYGGLNVLQWIYQSHLAGAETAANFVSQWNSLDGKIDLSVYRGNVTHQDIGAMLHEAASDAAKWAGETVQYFSKVSGIPGPPSPPTAPPAPPAPPACTHFKNFSGFLEHPCMYCKVGSTKGGLILDKKGGTLDDCYQACVTHSPLCICFEYLESTLECRLKSVTDLMQSAEGYHAYTIINPT